MSLPWTFSRRLPLHLSIACSLVFATACDESTTTGNPITIEDLTAALATAVGADPPAQEAEKTMLDLARQTCKVMAQSGGCDQGAPLLARSVASPGGGPMALLPVRNRWNTDVLRASSTPLAIPPLGLTCVWNVDADGWAGSPDIYGPVPSDRTRFEGYETEPGGPVLPLQQTNSFFDVAPLEQSGGQVDVELQSRDAGNNDATVVSLLLQGSVEPADGDVVDLLMSGRSGSSDATALDFVFSIDRTEVRNTMEIQDLLFISELDASGVGRFFIQRNNPRQIIEYNFSLASAGQAISTGNVFVGDEEVATMSGGRGAPLFDIVSNRFEESENLSFVYTQLQQLDLRVIDLFYFSYCIGANTPEVCDVMRDRLGIG